MDDDAEYSVVAKNVAGEVKSSAEVLVEPYVGKYHSIICSLNSYSATDNASEK